MREKEKTAKWFWIIDKTNKNNNSLLSISIYAVTIHNVTINLYYQYNTVTMHIIIVMIYVIIPYQLAVTSS